jgi:DNA-binding HxlR family transcriptional regulator
MRDLFCPVDAGCTVLAGKWRPRLLWKLHRYGVVRYGQFKRELPDITDKMLAQQLRDLERDGLVERTVYPVVPPRVEYRFTDFGRALTPVIEALETWSRAHEPRIRAALAAADRVPAAGADPDPTGEVVAA